MSYFIRPRADQLLVHSFEFPTWHRIFMRQVRMHDLEEIFSGAVPYKIDEPKLEDFILSDDTMTNGTSTLVAHNQSTLGNCCGTSHAHARFRDAHRTWERHGIRVRQARELLYGWVWDPLKLEIDLEPNPAQALQNIAESFRIRDYVGFDLESEACTLELRHFASMADYIYRHRRIWADLQAANEDYPQSQMVRNIFNGLPHSYDWKIDALKDVCDIIELTQELLDAEAEVKERRL